MIYKIKIEIKSIQGWNGALKKIINKVSLYYSSNDFLFSSEKRSFYANDLKVVKRIYNLINKSKVLKARLFIKANYGKAIWQPIFFNKKRTKADLEALRELEDYISIDNKNKKEI